METACVSGLNNGNNKKLFEIAVQFQRALFYVENRAAGNKSYPMA